MEDTSSVQEIDLSEVYARLNRVHFSGRLRSDVEIRWVDGIHDRKAQVVAHVGGVLSFDVDRTQHEVGDRMGVATTILTEMHRAKSFLRK